jgi:hypothetical protein
VERYSPSRQTRFHSLAQRHAVVVRGRIELPAFCFSGRRSYRLSYLTALVGTAGLEPTSSWTQTRRAASCATSREADGQGRSIGEARGPPPLRYAGGLLPPTPVGLAGFEPAASCTPCRRADQAALQPVAAGGSTYSPLPPASAVLWVLHGAPSCRDDPYAPSSGRRPGRVPAG